MTRPPHAASSVVGYASDTASAVAKVEPNSNRSRETGRPYRRILSHAKHIDCQICNSRYHVKCISLDPDDHIYIQIHMSTWYCKTCVSEIFPFNHIEDDELFVSDVNYFDFSLNNFDSISTRIFNPFELSIDRYYSPLYDIDPDINFYNEIDYHLVSQCNYYMENHFTNVISNRFSNKSLHDMLSLCHINIRSIKANLPSFEICLDNLKGEFSAIGMSET